MSRPEKALVNGHEAGLQELLAALHVSPVEDIHMIMNGGRRFEISSPVWNKILDAADAHISAFRIGTLRAAEESSPPRKCIVKGCQNHSDAGKFIGELCAPCHQMLTSGQIYYAENFIGKLQHDATQLQSIKSVLQTLLSTQEKQP